MTLRTRLIVAFLALALVPTALLTWFTLDRLGHSIELWNTRGVDRALQSALEVSKASLARMEATVRGQAEDWARALAPGPLTPGNRTAIRTGARAAGLDFIQLYRPIPSGHQLSEEVMPEGVLSAVPIDLGPEIPMALATDGVLRSPQGVLAAAAPMDSGWVLVAGMRIQPDFFDEVKRISEGVGFYRRFGVVRDISRTYMLLLVGALVLVLTGVAIGVATVLARDMTRPLHDLERALGRVAAGDLEARVKPDGARELRTLGERFNAMTGRLAAARTALQEAEREAAWREVARRLAHEFKNILTPMSLSLHRLRRRAAAVPQDERAAVADSLEALGRGVQQMTRLAEQFSQYARLPEPRFERVDLDEVVRESVALHEHEDVQVVIDPGPPLPVVGDTLLLSRAIHNLVLNACEASPPGSTVEVRTGTERGMAVLEVLDRGGGLPPEVKDRLFEPYVSTKRRGSGLGLSLVRDIVVQHRGAVTIENRAGGGASARVTLPLVEETETEAVSGV